MKFFLDMSDFLEISSLSHSAVFLYFFALITEQVFLISPGRGDNSWLVCIQMVYLSFSPLLLASLLFTAICKASPDSHFASQLSLSLFSKFFFHSFVWLHQVFVAAHSTFSRSTPALSPSK